MMENVPWKTSNWWVASYNFLDTVRKTLALPTQVLLHDATLRDGEQTPGVVLRKEEKVEIAKALDDVGVDRIEAGMPAVSEEDAEAVKAIAKLKLKSKIFTFCRATKADIDLSLDCGVQGVLIEIPCSYPKLKYQFGWTEQEVIDRSLESVSYAKEKGLYVTYFPYDTTRADFDFLRQLMTEVIRGERPNSIGIVDTMGCMLPLATQMLISTIKAEFDIPIEIHAHNDLGMGTANTLAAIGAGAMVAHVCVNGMGERSGNTALDEVAVGVRVLYGMDSRIEFSKLRELSLLVERLSGFHPSPNKPIVGSHMFVRESGIGIEMLSREPLAMFSLNPSFVGNRSGAVLGKKSGSSSIRSKVNELGIQVGEELIPRVLRAVKEKAITNKRLVTDAEFLEIIENI